MNGELIVMANVGEEGVQVRAGNIQGTELVSVSIRTPGSTLTVSFALEQFRIFAAQVQAIAIEKFGRPS